MNWIIHQARDITTITIVMFVMSLSFGACSNSTKEMVTVVFDPENTYTMKTVKVSTLISDSGVTRYRANADLFLMYEKASEPYWYFPEGINIEQFDTLFNVKANIKADTAWYYEKQDMWKGVGNVEITSLEGDHISTQLIYWNQKLHKIYSDQPTLIIQEGKIIRSQNGFESDEALSYYHLYNSSADMPFEEKMSSDTTSVEPGAE